MKEAILEIGDIVSWKGHWGVAPPANVEVIAIIITQAGGSDRLLGTPVDSIQWDKLIGENVLVGITGDVNKSIWAYGSQLNRKAL
jgi:hypothetical protein